MRFLDMLRMSGSNLWKRKVRTFLTVLGVVIGTASIVVMISIGLGLNKATLEEIQSYGSMTTINVYPSYNWDGTAEGQLSSQYLSNEIVRQIEEIDHVEVVSPVLRVDAIALSGKYMSQMSIEGMDVNALEQLGIELGEGRLPSAEDTELTLLYGNQILTNFYDKKTNEGYWDTGELPDIDLMNDTVFIIFDTDAYWSSQSPQDGIVVQRPKKYVIPACGIVAGDEETYNNFSYNVYCDIDQLEALLKRIFKNRAIPGQPTTQSGKPYKELYYSELYVNVDNMDNVTKVQEQIGELGCQTSSNMEWVESMQKQYSYIQAVLGGIGAVALFVAAIGIANTMMMSIYERTKEIGIMKVLGCNMRNIQSMFLIEAAFIGCIGGVLGVGLSYGVSAIVNKVSAGGSFMGVSTGMSYIPPWLSLLGIGFAIIVGTLAGFFPSLRAMRLSPLAAIRNE